MAIKRKKQNTTWISKKDIDRKWYIVDIQGETLGRTATRIAEVLTGKDKVKQVPNMDVGDYVIVINTDKLAVSDKKKLKQKLYFSHSGYPGGGKFKNLERMLNKDSRKVVQLAVSGMLPKNKLRKRYLTRLKLYKGKEHKHEAQKPEKIKLDIKT
jgi:large subunit ribosomal protein L13